MADLPRPERFLPLAPVWFEILLALAGGDLHGYAVMQEVARRSGGTVTLHPGSLYRALARLLEDALIVELDGRPGAGDDERRRYYQITPLGRAVARAEAERLRALVRAADAGALFAAVPSPKRGRT
jgi:DNA-binding PadR family transcriptional regulator